MTSNTHTTLSVTPTIGNHRHPIDVRFDELHLSNLSNHSHAEKLWDMLYTNKNINKSLIYLNDVENKAKKAIFLSIYHKVESLFINVMRSSGEPYFYHLLETAFIRLEESYEIIEGQMHWYSGDIIDIFYCLLHDIIEDTRKDFYGLRQDFGDKIAFGTHLISKKPFYNYIPEFSSDKYTYDNVVKMMDLTEYQIDLDEHIIETDTLNPNNVESYNQLRNKYRKIRSVKHFEKYENFDSFLEYAKQEALSLRMNFSDDELKEICYRIIQVKLCDRLHNMRTISHMPPETINRKIGETETYLLSIAKEINPIMSQKLIDQIAILRKQVPLGGKTETVKIGVVNKTMGSITQKK